MPYTQPRNADLLLQRFLTTHLRGIFLVLLLSNPISVVQCFHRAIRSVRNPPDNLHVRWLPVAELVVLCGACSYTGMCSESSLRQPCLRALFFQPVLEHHKAPPAKAFMDANVFAHTIYMKNHSCHDVCAGTKPCSCCYGTIQHLPRQQGIKKAFVSMLGCSINGGNTKSRKRMLTVMRLLVCSSIRLTAYR